MESQWKKHFVLKLTHLLSTHTHTHKDTHTHTHRHTHTYTHIHTQAGSSTLRSHTQPPDHSSASQCLLHSLSPLLSLLLSPPSLSHSLSHTHTPYISLHVTHSLSLSLSL